MKTETATAGIVLPPCLPSIYVDTEEADSIDVYEENDTLYLADSLKKQIKPDTRLNIIPKPDNLVERAFNGLPGNSLYKWAYIFSEKACRRGMRFSDTLEKIFSGYSQYIRVTYAQAVLPKDKTAYELFEEIRKETNVSPITIYRWAYILKQDKGIQKLVIQGKVPAKFILEIRSFREGQRSVIFKLLKNHLIPLEAVSILLKQMKDGRIDILELKRRWLEIHRLLTITTDGGNDGQKNY